MKIGLLPALGSKSLASVFNAKNVLNSSYFPESNKQDSI